MTGDRTKIEWADFTFNPWIGCTKVSPACDHCYAESWAKRTGHPELWQGERRRTTEANWRKPIKWDAEAARLGIRYKVFCASLADVFDNEVPAVWRHDLWDLIKATPHLDWLLLTKRIGNVEKMRHTMTRARADNIWLGTTVINQEEADRDVPKLLDTPAAVRFISVEPMLGPISIGAFMPWPMTTPPGRYGVGLDWVICGGESGPGARPMHPDWARSLRDQCQDADVAFFFKQMTRKAPIPADLMVREFPA